MTDDVPTGVDDVLSLVLMTAHPVVETARVTRFRRMEHDRSQKQREMDYAYQMRVFVHLASDVSQVCKAWAAITRDDLEGLSVCEFGGLCAGLCQSCGDSDVFCEFFPPRFASAVLDASNPWSLKTIALPIGCHQALATYIQTSGNERMLFTMEGPCVAGTPEDAVGVGTLLDTQCVPFSPAFRTFVVRALDMAGGNAKTHVLCGGCVPKFTRVYRRAGKKKWKSLQWESERDAERAEMERKQKENDEAAATAAGVQCDWKWRAKRARERHKKIDAGLIADDFECRPWVPQRLRIERADDDELVLVLVRSP